MAKKRKSNNPKGRPSGGLSEVSIEVQMPAPMRDNVRKAAAIERVTVTEFMRRAASVRLVLWLTPEEILGPGSKVVTPPKRRRATAP